MCGYRHPQIAVFLPRSLTLCIFCRSLALLRVRSGPRCWAARCCLVGSAARAANDRACPAALRSLILSGEFGFLASLRQGSRRGFYCLGCGAGAASSPSAPLTSNRFLPSPAQAELASHLVLLQFRASFEMCCAVSGITNNPRPLGGASGDPRSRAGRF